MRQGIAVAAKFDGNIHQSKSHFVTPVILTQNSFESHERLLQHRTARGIFIQQNPELY